MNIANELTHLMTQFAANDIGHANEKTTYGMVDGKVVTREQSSNWGGRLFGTKAGQADIAANRAARQRLIDGLLKTFNCSAAELEQKLGEDVLKLSDFGLDAQGHVTASHPLTARRISAILTKVNTLTDGAVNSKREIALANFAHDATSTGPEGRKIREAVAQWRLYLPASTDREIALLAYAQIKNPDLSGKAFIDKCVNDYDLGFDEADRLRSVFNTKDSTIANLVFMKGVRGEGQFDTSADNVPVPPDVLQIAQQQITDHVNADANAAEPQYGTKKGLVDINRGWGVTINGTVVNPVGKHNAFDDVVKLTAAYDNAFGNGVSDKMKKAVESLLTQSTPTLFLATTDGGGYNDEHPGVARISFFDGDLDDRGFDAGYTVERKEDGSYRVTMDIRRNGVTGFYRSQNGKVVERPLDPNDTESFVSHHLVIDLKEVNGEIKVGLSNSTSSWDLSKEISIAEFTSKVMANVEKLWDHGFDMLMVELDSRKFPENEYGTMRPSQDDLMAYLKDPEVREDFMKSARTLAKSVKTPLTTKPQMMIINKFLESYQKRDDVKASAKGFSDAHSAAYFLRQAAYRAIKSGFNGLSVDKIDDFGARLEVALCRPENHARGAKFHEETKKLSSSALAQYFKDHAEELLRLAA